VAARRGPGGRGRQVAWWHAARRHDAHAVRACGVRAARSARDTVPRSWKAGPHAGRARAAGCGSPRQPPLQARLAAQVGAPAQARQAQRMCVERHTAPCACDSDRRSSRGTGPPRTAAGPAAEARTARTARTTPGPDLIRGPAGRVQHRTAQVLHTGAEGSSLRPGPRWDARLCETANMSLLPQSRRFQSPWQWNHSHAGRGRRNSRVLACALSFRALHAAAGCTAPMLITVLFTLQQGALLPC
jgi:hypothetical protein